MGNVNSTIRLSTSTQAAMGRTRTRAGLRLKADQQARCPTLVQLRKTLLIKLTKRNMMKGLYMYYERYNQPLLFLCKNIMTLYCYHCTYEGVCCLVEFRIFPLREAKLLGGLVGHHAGDGEGGGGARRRGVAAVQHSRSEAGLEDEVPHEVALQVHGLPNEGCCQSSIHWELGWSLL